jgi:hypothetical protein
MANRLTGQGLSAARVKDHAAAERYLTMIVVPHAPFDAGQHSRCEELLPVRYLEQRVGLVLDWLRPVYAESCQLRG